MHPIWGFVSLLTCQRVAVRARSKAICLTFDDGPHPEHTPRLLDLLRRHAIHATFFLQGRYVEQYPQLVARLVAEGHVIGNHSFNHPSFAKLTLSRQVEEIRQTETLLTRFDGRSRHPFRPPYGRLTVGIIAWCLLHRHRITLWSFDSLDFRLSEQEICERAQRSLLSQGSILLFHDDSVSGALALDRLIPLWRAAGLEFTTV